MDVYLNGTMVEPSEARIAFDDAGLQHGVGLFETMSVHRGKAFRAREHVDRLIHSAATLGLTREIDPGGLQTAIEQTIRHNQLDQARLRLTVTAGSVSLLRNSPEESPAPQPTVLIVPSEPTTYDPAYFERGVTVTVVPSAANPFDPMAGHKTLAYWQRLRTLRQAASLGAGEAVWLTTTNHLAGGAISNLFLVKDGQLLTPFARGEEVQGSLPAPVRPGITRSVVLELAEKNHIPSARRVLDIQNLLDADEVFLTNSSWRVLPVARVEKKTIGSGSVGPVTAKLRDAVLELIERETSAAP